MQPALIAPSSADRPLTDTRTGYISLNTARLRRTASATALEARSRVAHRVLESPGIGSR
jgi:hypothetical protein